MYFQALFIEEIQYFSKLPSKELQISDIFLSGDFLHRKYSSGWLQQRGTLNYYASRHNIQILGTL